MFNKPQEEPSQVLPVYTPEPEHAHVWLPANNGMEWVCGDCHLRKPAKL